MNTKPKILAGCYRNWSTKTIAQKTQAYQEEAGDDYSEVKAELKRLAGFEKCHSPSKSSGQKDREIVRDLQSIFCKGRYRSWKPVPKKNRAK
jgi:hypothetical protein